MLMKLPKTMLLPTFLLLSNLIYAQKDSIVFKIPTEGDKVVYSGTVAVNNKNRLTLEAASKAWLVNYFKSYRSAIPADSQDSSSVFSQGLLEYKVRPGMVNIPFFCQITLRITCKDNTYAYRISDIFFRPKSDFLNAAGYQNSPDYLVKVGRRKHLGFGTAWKVSRGQIREYLAQMNTAILACTASLNKAMTE